MIKANVWVDGEPCTVLPTDDRGLAYGDGVFETVKVVSGQMMLDGYHWDRLQTSCRQLGIDADIVFWQQTVSRFLADRATGILKMIVTRGSGGRGYNPKGCRSRLILSWHVLPEYPAAYWQKGVALYPCATVLGLQPSTAGLKHLNRLEQVVARSEWDDPRYAEGLLKDLNGNLIEGTMTNLFLVTSEGLWTPDLKMSGVAGVMRQWILDNMPQYGIKTQVSDISLDALQKASEVFVCNSVNGVWPVVAYADLQWAPGPVTRHVQSAVSGILNV
ncbi:aminodeoxychorismate lyase [Kistimonas asteriae]|uniref:aminodeoxychorismate lyase n=1 Tax=Kistimonas asteriae TaxID=517724 RepID=UPI001BACCA75|nr:aminodeoxychorismate lyase [Kistimonas asteriae]